MSRPLCFVGTKLCPVIIPATFQKEGLVQKSIAFSLFLLIFGFTACSRFPQTSPAAPPTLAPTMTSLPLAQTPEAVSSLIPEGGPASEWNGIPIMPGATAGDGEEESYVFTIRAAPQQVQAYYQAELPKLGWQEVATQDQASSLMLTFTNKTSATLTISIIAKGDQVLVLLMK